MADTMTTTFRGDWLKKIKRIAKREGRSPTNLISQIVVEWLRKNRG